MKLSKFFIVVNSTLAVMALSWIILFLAEVSTRPYTIPKMACHLTILKGSETDRLKLQGLLELRNTSSIPVVVEYRTYAVREQLDLEVTDENGRILPKSSNCYGDSYVNSFTIYEHTFKPGEMTREKVMLLLQVERDWPIPPGTYTVQAIFRYQGETIRSNKVKVELLPEK